MVAHPHQKGEEERAEYPGHLRECAADTLGQIASGTGLPM
jgi:hypothetical protein